MEPIKIDPCDMVPEMHGIAKEVFSIFERHRLTPVQSMLVLSELIGCICASTIKANENKNKRVLN